MWRGRWCCPQDLKLETETPILLMDFKSSILFLVTQTVERLGSFALCSLSLFDVSVLKLWEAPSLSCCLELNRGDDGNWEP